MTDLAEMNTRQRAAALLNGVADAQMNAEPVTIETKSVTLYRILRKLDGYVLEPRGRFTGRVSVSVNRETRLLPLDGSETAAAFEDLCLYGKRFGTWTDEQICVAAIEWCNANFPIGLQRSCIERALNATLLLRAGIVASPDDFETGVA